MFIAALALIGLEASGVLNPEGTALTTLAIALFAVAAVIWGLLALMRFRR